MTSDVKKLALEPQLINKTTNAQQYRSKDYTFTPLTCLLKDLQFLSSNSEHCH